MSPAFQKQCRGLGNDFLVGLTMCIWRHCATVGTIVVWNIQFSDSFNSNPDKVECSVKMTELWPNWVDSDIRRSELGRTPDLIHFTGLISCLDKQLWWKLTLLTHLSSLSRPRLVACVSFCQQVIMSWSWRRKQIILKMNWAELSTALGPTFISHFYWQCQLRLALLGGRSEQWYIMNAIQVNFISDCLPRHRQEPSYLPIIPNMCTGDQHWTIIICRYHSQVSLLSKDVNVIPWKTIFRGY